MRLFFILFFTLYGIINFYFFLKLKSGIHLKWYFQLSIVFFLFIMIFSPLLIRVLERNDYELLAIGLSWIGYLWMSFVVLFLFFGILTDFGRLLVSALLKISGQSLSIKSIRISFFLFPFTISLIFLIYGYLEALNIRTENIVIETDKIKKDVRIVQISDVHIGLIVREKRIKRIIERIKESNPDIVVSTGDLVDAQIDRLNHLAEILREIEVPYGKFAITGNHEFYAGLDKALSFLNKAGFEILRNKEVRIDELNIRIVGVDDPEAIRYGISPNMEKSVLRNSYKGFTILLKHRPLIDKELIGYFNLQLSGHTHKGQFFPFNILTHFYYDRGDSGLRKLSENTYIYVSRGTGTWGPPIRIFAPPEITVVDLKKI